MAREAFRFIHATALNLDEPLVIRGRVPKSHRHYAEDATLIAWERTVSQAIERDCDFILLSGNAFDGDHVSLRTRVALMRGFEKLDEHAVEVFVVPGLRDPASVWKRFDTLPSNVTLIESEQSEPSAIVRDGRVLATVFAIATPASDEVDWTDDGPAALQTHRAPFRIGVVSAGTPLDWADGHPCPPEHDPSQTAAANLVRCSLDNGLNYLALGDGERRQWSWHEGTAHDPGRLQCLDEFQAGIGGCSLVDVSSEGTIDIEHLTVAPVRWETIELDFDVDSDWTTSIANMVHALRRHDPDPNEQLRAIEWRLQGAGEVIEALSERETEEELWELLEAELGGAEGPELVHLLTVHHRDALRKADELDDLAASFNRTIEDYDISRLDGLRQELLQVGLIQRRHATTIQRAIDHADIDGVLTEARKLGLAWLK